MMIFGSCTGTIWKPILMIKNIYRIKIIIIKICSYKLNNINWLYIHLHYVRVWIVKMMILIMPSDMWICKPVLILSRWFKHYTDSEKYRQLIYIFQILNKIHNKYIIHQIMSFKACGINTAIINSIMIQCLNIQCFIIV